MLNRSCSAELRIHTDYDWLAFKCDIETLIATGGSDNDILAGFTGDLLDGEFEDEYVVGDFSFDGHFIWFFG